MLHVRFHHHHCSHQTFHQSPPPPNAPALIRFLLSDLPSDVLSIAHSGSVSYLSLRFRFREPLLWDFVMCSADQIRFRYRYNCSQFFSLKFRFQMRFYLLLQSRMSADCADEAASASGAQSSLPAQASKVAPGASRNGSCS